MLSTFWGPGSNTGPFFLDKLGILLYRLIDMPPASNLPINTLRELHRSGDYAAIVGDEVAVEPGDEDTESYLLFSLALFMSGDTQRAQPMLKKAVSGAAENHAWRSDQALANLLLGDLSAALELLSTVIDSSEACGVDYGRLAAIATAQGNMEDASAYYSEAVNREPGRHQWHYNLAVIYTRRQLYEEALEQLDMALMIEPDDERSQAARLAALSALDRTEDVVAQLEDKFQQNPEDLLNRLSYSRALMLDGRWSDSLAVLKEREQPIDELLRLKEEDSEAFEETKREQIQLRGLRAEFLQKHSRYQAAYRVCDDILALEPEEPLPVQITRLSALVEMGRIEEAEEALEPLLEEHPENNQLKIAQANLLNEDNRYREAESLLRELVAVYPGDAGLLSNLGQTLLWVGELDEAARCFEKAGEINPMALAQIVKTRKMPENPASLERMERIADNKTLAREPRANMSFALAEIYDKQKDFEKAYNYLAQANELTNRDLKYRPELFSNRVDANIKIFTNEFFDSLPGIRAPDRTPVFVVGMPRSGTTLTEQILCSHPDVYGAGELDLLPVLVRLMPRVLRSKRLLPGCMRSLTPELREEAARYYLFGLDQHDREMPFVVDKMPHNFMNLGLIASTLSTAKIIHIQRDPRDNALSNLQQNFKAKDGGMGYAFSQENIGLQINDYHRMMVHWRDVLPIPIFELTYEELVSDQEGMTRELLDFIGVDWDDSVRDFHKTERAVRTASVSQVRQPIYASSKQKWRNYEEYLAPLIQTLEPDILAPWDAQ